MPVANQKYVAYSDCCEIVTCQCHSYVLVQVKLIKSNNCKPVPIMEKFSALIGVASCVVQDISLPKQLEVNNQLPIVYMSLLSKT